MIKKVIYSLGFLILISSCKVNTAKTAESIKSQSINFDYFSGRAKIKLGKYMLVIHNISMLSTCTY